jgi:hypothetical protein
MPSSGHNRNLETPLQEAQRVSSSWHESVSSLLDACERIHLVLDSFDEDETKLAQFIKGLVKGRVLTEREGKLGIGSPKLSKLRTIGQHADLLRRRSITTHLTPEYSVLYQLCVLYKKLPDDDQKNKLVKFENVIEACSGELSRDYLASATKRIKREKKRKRSDTTPEAEKLQSFPTLADLISRELIFDLLLITPTKRELSVLASDYETNALQRCLPLFKLIDHTSAVGFVVVTSVSDLTTITTKLLPISGFSDFSNILLTREPETADITDATVLVISKKGAKLKPHFPKNEPWFEIGNDRVSQTDAVRIAETVFPSLGRRLHVFAEHASDGWQALIGDRSWIELPSLK